MDSSTSLRPFKAKTLDDVRALQQGVPYKRAPSADRFIDLPASVLDDLGEEIPRGSAAGDVKIHAAVLSGFGFFYKLNLGQETTISFENGDSVHLGETAFLLSARTVARNLYERWFWATRHHSDEKAFGTFHDRVRGVASDLVERGHLKKLGAPREGSHGRQGTLWTMKGTPVGEAIEKCARRPASSLLLLCPSREAFEHEGYINAVDLLGGRYAREKGALDTFVHAEARTRLRGPHRLVSHRGWTLRNACRSSEKGHISTGTYRKHQFEKGQLFPAFMPHLVLDIDPKPAYGYDKREKSRVLRRRRFPDQVGPIDHVDFLTIERAREIACRILETFIMAGCNREDLICCFSGNRGFHVYIPAGALGLPVFPNQAAAKESLSAFTGEVLREKIDENLLSPRHLVRAIGSVREETGYYKQAFYGDEFLRLPTKDILDRSERFSSFPIPDPREVAPVPELTKKLAAAGMNEKAVRSLRLADRAPSRGKWSEMAQQAAEGCIESEKWWPGHQGRNDLIFTLACYLLERLRLSEEQAQVTLEEVNDRNDPPLAAGPLKRALQSAVQRTRGH